MCRTIITTLHKGRGVYVDVLGGALVVESQDAETKNYWMLTCRASVSGI